MISEPCFYIFEWHIPNKRKDPDNISSLGRKLIFDSLQVAGKLPNDNLAYIVGTADVYTIDGFVGVRVKAIPLTELDGYVKVELMVLENEKIRNRQTNKQKDSRPSNKRGTANPR